MSWSVPISVTPVEGFLTVLQGSEPSTFGGALKPEVVQQLQAAREAAQELLESGCLGSPSHVTATLSGHANDGHQKMPGFANDVVSVSIAVADPPTPIEGDIAAQQTRLSDEMAREPEGATSATLST
jgi:hypothetical protein